MMADFVNDMCDGNGVTVVRVGDGGNRGVSVSKLAEGCAEGATPSCGALALAQATSTIAATDRTNRRLLGWIGKMFIRMVCLP